MMAAAAAQTALCEYHVAEFDRQQGIGLDRIVHPDARHALADKDEQMRPGKRIIFGAAAMEHGMRHHRIGELDRHARKRRAEHAANEPDVTGNDRIDEFAQAAKARDRNADLRKPDPAPPRPVPQQLQRIVKHPADGFDRRRFRQRQTFGILQFVGEPADADAQPRAGQLECRKPHRVVERYQSGRATEIRRRPPHLLDQAFGLEIKQDARQARLGQAHRLGQRRPKHAARLEQMPQNGRTRLPPASRLLRHFHPCRHSYLV